MSYFCSSLVLQIREPRPGESWKNSPMTTEMREGEAWKDLKDWAEQLGQASEP